jgi:hypothetical protein
MRRMSKGPNVEFNILWPIVRDSVANLFWRDHELPLKSAMALARDIIRDVKDII